MDTEELKKKIKEKGIDRRDLAEKIGVSPSHLTCMLNDWQPLKENYKKIIEKELED